MCAVLRGARRCWSISPACRAPSSKPAAHCCSGRQMGKTDGRTPDRISAAHSMRAVWITCDDYFWYRFGSGGDINTLHGFTLWQPSVLWRCWLGGQELGVRPVKIEWWGVGVDLSGARCRLFAYGRYGPADATAIPKPHHLLPHLNPVWFYLSGTVLPRLS